MKNLKEFILEKFKINSNNASSQNIEYNKDNYKEALELLNDEAEKHNCRIKFKNHPNGNTGDFTIFIYKAKSRTYDVGFDGDWDEFDQCYHQSLDWLEKNFSK